MQLHEDGEHAVIAGPRLRVDTVRDFPLQHERRIDEATATTMSTNEREQDRGGHVIRKVSRDSEAQARRERVEIELEEVGLNERHVRRRFRRQQRNHLGIELDRGDARHSRCQPQRQRSGAGADLEKSVVGFRVDCRNQLVRPCRLQKVLSVSFLRPHADQGRTAGHTSSSDSPRQYFSSISSISSSLIPK